MRKYSSPVADRWQSGPGSLPVARYSASIRQMVSSSSRTRSAEINSSRITYPFTSRCIRCAGVRTGNGEPPRPSLPSLILFKIAPGDEQLDHLQLRYYETG